MSPAFPPARHPHALNDTSGTPDAVSLTAEVSHVTYYNPVTSYLVAKVKAEHEPGYVTVVGALPQVAPGAVLRLLGRWVEHPKFGRQFEASGFEEAMPATESGVRRYLGSGMIRGVGKVTADRMVDAFGLDVLRVLDEEPKKLLRVEGIGKKRLKEITDSWRSQREIRDLMLFLQTHEVPPTFAARIFRHYGAGAVEKLKDNPYDLAYDIRGVGFLTADQMALRLGFALDSPQRLEAAVVYALFKQSDGGGHLFVPLAKLLPMVADLLRGRGGPNGYGDEDCSMDEGSQDQQLGLEQAVRGLAESRRIVVEDLPEQGVERAVYLAHHFKYEREIAARLHALAEHPAPVDADRIEAVLPGLEGSAGIELSDEQRWAVLEACRSKVFVITGGPGTGKTTITRILVRVLDELGLKIKLAAPTGRAAKRLSEATGFGASTIHRLLQYAADGSFLMGEDHKLKADVLVVDEVSMLDVELCLHLLRALPLTCRLVLIGDVNQLPSVGPGTVLADLLASERLPSAVLNRIFRQAAESLIVVNAHRVNQGEFPDEGDDRQAPEKDFFWVDQDDPERARRLILQLVMDRIPEMYGLDPMRDIQVLSPMHKGDLGTLALNTMLQDALNPSTREIRRGRNVFRLGDRVLQLRNNYEKEVFNGDLGRILDLDVEEGAAVVDFDGVFVAYEAMEMDELAPAYAISVHKSQGSEYPAIILPVVTQHYMLLQRNLIYTALTRARRLAVLLGSRRAMHMGLSKKGGGVRFSHLRHRIREAFDRVNLLDF